MSSCLTTTATPVTVLISDSNVGSSNFGSFTQYVSADTYVVLVFNNQVSKGVVARVRIAYSGSNLFFFSAPS